jgi:glycosyltransferase involved in cell wall biosynthesis
VVARERSAILVPDRDEAALAAAIGRLIGDADLRRRMGEAASRFARQERNGEGARAILGGALDALMHRRGATSGEAAS